MNRGAFQREVLRIVVITVGGLAAGWSMDYPLYGLLAGLAVSHLFSLRNANAFYRWSFRTGPAPQDSGLIGYGTDRVIRREKTLKNRLLNQAKLLQRYNQGIESLQDGVIILNEEGHINTFNGAAARVLRLRQDDVGQHVKNLIRAPQFVRFYDKGDFSEPLQFELRNYVLQIQVTEFGLDQKIMLVRNVTERKRVEVMRQNFIADVSHELRTPLTVINGYLEMFNDMEVPTPMVRAMKQMKSQSERMTNLVNDLIELSKLESASSERSRELFSLSGLCQQVIGEMKGFSETAKVHFKPVDNTKFMIEGFEAEMHSVLTNLMTNGIKYGSNEEIFVSLSTSDRGIKVSIKDKGPGIPPQHLTRLTERFYRVDESRESAVGGSGLGLAIVKHALEHHDSELEIESIQGKGSTFSFVIPSLRNIDKV
ncbi:MAG: phosphate regulon sensor histidine kinase PhoR [Oceanobacter sp.]|nr:MAG: phosphate regulon sensor histidine kinase PhoR [Oceanobacter sp.]